jgi:hypothetical protein
MLSTGILLGSHGCDADVAQKVVSGSADLSQSNNDYDWLGHGSYFWEANPERALRWAHEEGRHRGKIQTPAVLGALISPGRCLNLIEADAAVLIRAAYCTYRELCRTSGKTEARNVGRDSKARYLDCAVFETLHRLREAEGALPFDTVRGFFIEGTELYPGAGIRDRDHIQICVRKPAQILGFFLPRVPKRRG